MKKILRPILTLAASFFTYLLIVVFVPLFTDVRYSTATWLSVPVALFAGWYTWQTLNTERTGFIATVFTGAILVGGISFIAGFFGPIIFMPGANQGPLLGIFITGPLGLLAGAIGGYIFWLRTNMNFDNKLQYPDSVDPNEVEDNDD